MTLDEARDYVKSVNWCFAKTYLSAPHEYTVNEWKPELHNTMIAFARYIRDAGKITYFYGRPFIKLTLDGYQYWTMDADVRDTVLINRTFADDARCQRIKAYVMSDKYQHQHRETLEQIERRI